MQPGSRQRSTHRVLLAASVVAMLWPLASSASDVWDADEPAQGAPVDPQARERSGTTLEERVRPAGDLESRTVESGSLEGRGATAGDPEPSARAASGPEARESSSRRLGELPEAAAGEGPIPFELPDPASWEPTSDPELRAARQDFRVALDRAESAIAAYSEMRDRNYPRGEERIEIVRERDESLRALRAAKRALEAAEERR